MKLILPWPPAALSPNARVHWRVKAKAAKSYRYACWVLALRAHVMANAEGPINVHLEFVPEHKRQRDLDNCIASAKSLLDGLADALRVNDNRFVLTASLAEVGGGEVRVSVT